MKLQRLLTGAMAMLAMGGCAAPAPYLAERMGTAVDTAKAQQTVNPDASRDTDPAAGIDGSAAASAVDEYRNTFKTPPPTFPVINVGVGGNR